MICIPPGNGGSLIRRALRARPNVIEALENRMLLSAALTTLATFNIGNGSTPIAGLTVDSSGNLYGVTQNGGPGGQGTVFEVPAGATTAMTLASFDGTNGASPVGTPILDSTGNLYGTTESSANHGAVFELPAGASAVSILADLIDVNGSSPKLDGSQPAAGLVRDSAGDLFGTAEGGGANLNGTVFELPVGASSVTAIVTFNTANGSFPIGGLIADSNGNLYGATSQGGANNDGTIFEIASGSNNLTTLATFNGANGMSPQSSLLLDSSGNLFGTANSGGANGDGTIFEVTAGSSSVTTLVDFNGTNGSTPSGGLIFDSAGDLYGTTSAGGAGNNDGTIFQLPASAHAVTTLYSFAGADGANPRSTLLADATGTLFGTTQAGGWSNEGTVFKLADTGFVTPTKLVFSQAPANVIAGQTIAPAVAVSEEDINGNPLAGTSSVTLTIGGTAGTTLGGTLTEPLVNGVATFSDLSISAIGGYTLIASDATDSPAISGIISATSPAKLVFTQPPVEALAGATITPPIAVSEEDLSGNVLTAGNSSVTLAVGGDAGATLGGTLTEPLVNGVATFSNLVINAAGNYTLTATDGSDTPVTSGSFTVAVPTLVPTLASSTLPAYVVGGAKVHGVFAVNVVNQTQTTQTGTLTIKVFATSDGAIDGAATMVATQTKHVKMKPGQSKIFRLNISSLPASLPNGTYTLVSQAIAPTGVINDSAPGSTVKVEAPFVQLTDTIGAVSPATLKPGKAGVIAITVTNTGNVATTGNATFNIGTSTDGQTEAATLVNQMKGLKIKNGQSKTVRIRFIIPAGQGAGTLSSFIAVTQDGSTTAAVGQTSFTIG